MLLTVLCLKLFLGDSWCPLFSVDYVQLACIAMPFIVSLQSGTRGGDDVYREYSCQQRMGGQPERLEQTDAKLSSGRQGEVDPSQV